MKTKALSIALAAILTAGSAKATDSWTLQRCIDYALENNIQIRQSDIAAQSREVDLSTARGNRLPDLSASASQNWSFGRSLTIDNTYANTNTASTSFSVGTGVTLFAGGRISGNIENAKLGLDAAKSDLERMKDDVRVQVAESFIQIVYNQSILEVAQNQEIGRASCRERV